MKKTGRHIIEHIIVSAVAFLSGSALLVAQHIEPTRRWMDEFHTVRPLFSTDTITLRFIGDVMMHSKQIAEASQDDGTFDFSSYFRLIENKLRTADLTVANMEFALGGEPFSGYPAFSAPDEIARYAAGCGIDIFLAANNHIYDKGTAGAIRTIGKYKELEETYGVRYTGLALDAEDERKNHPLMSAPKGIRLAMINFTYATNGGRRKGWPKVNYLEDKEDITLAMEVARRKNADLIIALPHWGNEYELKHSTEQEEVAQWLADEGADIIIGAHPHVVQDTSSLQRNIGKAAKAEKGKAVPVAYSLGNAVSNMSARNTQLELMATVRIIRDAKGQTRMLPMELTFLWCSRPGGFDGRYTVVPVEEYIGKRNVWMNGQDYDNMMETYRRVKQTTGIR